MKHPDFTSTWLGLVFCFGDIKIFTNISFFSVSNSGLPARVIAWCTVLSSQQWSLEHQQHGALTDKIFPLKCKRTDMVNLAQTEFGAQLDAQHGAWHCKDEWRVTLGHSIPAFLTWKESTGHWTHTFSYRSNHSCEEQFNVALLRWFFQIQKKDLTWKRVHIGSLVQMLIPSYYNWSKNIK